MSKPFVFVSCGQFAESEKNTGATIVELVRSLTDYEAFFAEDQHDLAGLDDNILSALRDCAGFICVLHPRGSIVKQDGTTFERASVWIEQEIAIATYIKRTEKRELPAIAFIHESIALEGLRQLIHLGPIRFHDDFEIPGKLAAQLKNWNSLTPGGSGLVLSSRKAEIQDNHQIRRLSVSFRNNSSELYSTYNILLSFPSAAMKHWSEQIWGEIQSDDQNLRRFRIDQKERDPLWPKSVTAVFECRYCVTCAKAELEPMLDIPLTCKAYLDGKEYSLTATLRNLISEAGDEIKFR